jgi:Mg/Co/Ni transporter MgtE
MGPERVVFALFTPPDKITVMEEPLKPLNQEQKHKVTDVLISHEIFHYLEEENKSEIFTRTKKILLWKIGPLKNESTINALSEIAAMAFCRELCELELSPFALDVFLYYGYDQERAYDLYDEIMGISEKLAV